MFSFDIAASHAPRLADFRLMVPHDVDQLMEVALMQRQADPGLPARRVLDAVMLTADGKAQAAAAASLPRMAWLGPRTAWAGLLREAFAPEVEDDFALLLDDPDPEVRAVLVELWQRTVVKRFGRCYLGW